MDNKSVLLIILVLAAVATEGWSKEYDKDEGVGNVNLKDQEALHMPKKGGGFSRWVFGKL